MATAGSRWKKTTDRKLKSTAGNENDGKPTCEIALDSDKTKTRFHYRDGSVRYFTDVKGSNLPSHI